MNEEEIRKQLEIKNKEIYLNKLKLDLNNNLEVLVLSIDNLLNKQAIEAVKRILRITESFQNEEIITTNINEFIENYRIYLMSLIETKKIELEKLFKDPNDLNKYKTYLQDNIMTIKNKLDEYYNNNINKLIDTITSLYDDSFCILRIDEYLKNIWRENLNDKVIDTIKGRDIILLNTFKESFLKYQELNKNTIGLK